MTTHVNESNLAPKKTRAIGLDTVIIGALVLGFAALIIYQLFFCGTCYGTSIH